MFKLTFAFGLLVLASKAYGMSDEMKELAAMLRSSCAGETGVDISIVEKVNSDKVMPDDDKLKCYIKCILTQMGCISDDGVVDPEATLAVLPDEFREKAAPAIKSCGAKTGSNPCESAWLTHKCYLETDPAAYMLP